MKTKEQHISELYNKIKEILKDYPDSILEIASHDGGVAELTSSDIEFEELELRIYKTQNMTDYETLDSKR